MSVLYHDSVLVFIFYIIYHEGTISDRGGNFRERERTSCVKKTVFKLYPYRGRRLYGGGYFNADDAICA